MTNIHAFQIETLSTPRTQPRAVAIRKTARIEVARPRLVALPDLALNDIEIELLSRFDATNHREAWANLAERALERNVFYEPAFALSAATHLPDGQRPLFLFAWDKRLPKTASHALLACFPLTTGRSLLGAGELFGWRHPQIPLGTPLIAASAPVVIARAVFDWVATRTGIAGLFLPNLPQDGLVAAALGEAARQSGRVPRVFGAHERAILRAGDATPNLSGGKNRKERLRLARRLAERAGPLTIEHITEAHALQDATELFMAIEASGWKAKAGTCFVQNPATAAFLRALIRAESLNGHCRIDVLRAGDQPVAAAIILTAGKKAWYWKTAYCETFAPFSPGVQLTALLTGAQLDNPGCEMTDSCAIADHPMIDGLWPSRMPIADWLVPARAEPSAALALVAARQTAKRGLRSAAKSLYHTLRIR